MLDAAAYRDQEKGAIEVMIDFSQGWSQAAGSAVTTNVQGVDRAQARPRSLASCGLSGKGAFDISVQELERWR
jgi:hypothetical protein